MPEKDEWLEKLLSAAPAENPDSEIEVDSDGHVETENTQAEENETQKQQRKAVVNTFTKLIESGVPPQTAAKKVKAELVNIPNRDRVLKLIEDTLSKYSVSADVMRASVRAARMKVLLEGIASDDPDLILNAAKQIASDPEVGLNAPPATNVKIEIGSLKEVLQTVDLTDVIEIKE